MSTATTVTLAAHVEQLGTFKRGLDASAYSSNAKRLNGGSISSTPFPATSARPDQRTNSRFPVARATYSRLTPGEVVFVSRHYKMGHVGASNGLGGLTHVASLRELNGMLSQPHNHVASDAAGLFSEVTSKLRVANKDGSLKRAKFKAFNASKLVASTHPLQQFALDGLVATRMEDDATSNSSSSRPSQSACIVAAKGPAPMLLAQKPVNVVTGVSSFDAPPEPIGFLAPARVLATVYVVLVAVAVDDTVQKWQFKYEVVTSSNLDVNPAFATAPLYKTAMRRPKSASKTGDKLVLRAFKLGTVVDTAFGSASEPQLVVNVCISPYESTRVDLNKVDGKDRAVRRPKNVFETFFGYANPILQKSKSLQSPLPSAPSRSMSGARPKMIGNSAADLTELRRSIAEMKLIISDLSKQVKDSAKREADAISELRGRIDALVAQSTQSEGAASALKDEVRAFVERQNDISRQVSKLLVEERVFNMIAALSEGQAVVANSAEEELMLEFAQKVVDEFNLRPDLLDDDDDPFVPNLPQPTAEV